MRQITGYALWLGHAGDLIDARHITSAGIQVVIELAGSEPPATLPRDIIRCRFPLLDGGENPTWLLRLASDSVAALLRAKVPVLICCSAGLSRSLAVAAGALALVEGIDFSNAIARVAENRPTDLSPQLVMQMQMALPQGRDKESLTVVG